MTLKNFITLLVVLASGITKAAGPLQPAGLTVEYIRNPLGIDTKKPRFSWTFTATASAAHHIRSGNRPANSLSRGLDVSPGISSPQPGAMSRCPRTPESGVRNRT